jgi:hypothetical protein
MSRTRSNQDRHPQSPKPHHNRGAVHVALEATGDLDGTEGRVLSRHRTAKAAAIAAGKHARRALRDGYERQVTIAVVQGRPISATVRSRDSLPLAPQEVVDSSTPPTPRGLVREGALVKLEAAFAAMRARRSA